MPSHAYLCGVRRPRWADQSIPGNEAYPLQGIGYGTFAIYRSAVSKANGEFQELTSKFYWEEYDLWIELMMVS